MLSFCIFLIPWTPFVGLWTGGCKSCRCQKSLNKHNHLFCRDDEFICYPSTLHCSLVVALCSLTQLLCRLNFLVGGLANKPCFCFTLQRQTGLRIFLRIIFPFTFFLISMFAGITLSCSLILKA